ncbi:MAG: tyrosine protein phosphatase [Candidatus Paralactobacillus gallistercoris]|uniref:Tyrosine-protein phosphatase n=1 Tax=Candidatus Paralactobacillus gallistercoris TaxID=2838724 RepID=A0A948TJQ9_9LACO|nr:tyrosine protein phosphatase [Candidatus Paralactobacillus gallistercoris]
MIDLHSHILPGVDDGSPDMEHSLALAQVAVDNGITHTLLTPHHMDGKYTNHKVDVIRKTQLFQAELTRHNIPLTVFPCQEVHLTGDLIQAIDADDILFADEGNHYLMLELPHSHVPTYFMDDILPELEARRIVPVIVHPERNQGIQANPDLLYELVENGCLTQLTASSYLDIFGKHVTELTQQIIDAGLGAVFSSDAHNLKGRNFRMQAAFDKLTQQNGLAKTQWMQANAKHIINGEEVTLTNFTKVGAKKKKKHFWFF